jgi:PAS domain-containing protein
MIIENMLAALTQSLAQHDWQLVAAAIACFIASVLVLAWHRRTRKQTTHLRTALNNMSEGLCMFDASARLILCNERYT